MTCGLSFFVKKVILRGNLIYFASMKKYRRTDMSSSSLAAYSLHQLGLLNATDIIGGYDAWRNAGLPIDLDRRESRSLVSLAGSVV